MCERVVWYVGGFELPDKNAAAHRVLANAELLKLAGFKICFIGIDRTLNRVTNLNLIQTKHNGFSCYSVGYPRSIMEWINYLTDISYIINLKEPKPDIIIAYNFPAIALQRLYKYGKLKHIKIISDCTEWYQPTGNFIFKLMKGLDTNYRMRIIHPKLDGIIVISRYLYDYYSTKMKNVIYLPPLVDKSLAKWNYKIVKRNDNSIRLVYAGSPGNGEKDRLDRIINILSKIRKKTNRNILLDVIGVSRDEYLRKLEVDSSVVLFVSFLGRKSHLDTIDHIKKSDFEIFIRENNLVNRAGFPTKFVESISCGTPVLTNLSSNLVDYIEEGQNGYILDITNEDTLFSTLEKALEQNNESIYLLKKHCQDQTTFDYRSYFFSFSDFLISIFKI